jgi:hypothetical protein
MLTWGILFPAGMVLGLTKSKWHVPVQSLATLLYALVRSCFWRIQILR